MNCIDQRVAPVHNRLSHQVALRFEVPEKGAARSPSCFGDLVDSCFVKSLLEEKADCGIPDRVSRKFLLALLEARSDRLLDRQSVLGGFHDELRMPQYGTRAQGGIKELTWHSVSRYRLFVTFCVAISTSKGKR